MDSASLLPLSTRSLLLEEMAAGVIVEDEICPNRVCQIFESLKILRLAGYFVSTKVLSDDCLLSNIDRYYNDTRPCWFSMIDPEDEKLNGLQELIIQLICTLGTMRNDFNLSDECIIELEIQVGF